LASAPMPTEMPSWDSPSRGSSRERASGSPFRRSTRPRSFAVHRSRATSCFAACGAASHSMSHRTRSPGSRAGLFP
jgi:hypothetical protein